MSLTEGLVALLRRPVDPSTRERAALHVLDWIGNACLGATAEAGRILLAYGRAQAAGPSTALGAGAREASAAAFVNGGLGNLFEMDDLHRLSIVHPGPVVVPAALAVAQREGAGGGALLDAVVRGYEAGIRVGSAVGLGHYAYWHNTATCGVFGAAAACADLLGLDEGRAVDALGQAGIQACGLWQCRVEPTMSKQLNTARAAQSGVIAADLAALGLVGARAILEGPLGFFAATCPDADPAAVTAGPGAPWKVYETSFKPWAACRHAHPVIEAALALGRDLDGATIEAVEIVTYREAVAFCDKPEPRTSLDARFSLQHCAAVALLDGVPGLDAFEPAALARADVAALRRKVSIVEDDRHTTAFPARYGSEMTISLADGERRHAAVATAKGDPENPMAEDEIVAKARTLMAAAGLAEGPREALVEAALGLGAATALAGLSAAMSAARL